MINLFKWKKRAVLILWPILGACAFYGGMLFDIAKGQPGIVGGMIFLLCFTFFAVILGSFLLHNPFLPAVEGDGILCIDLSSKGILQSFMLYINDRILTNKKGTIKTLYDREIVSQMKAPIVAQMPWKKRLQYHPFWGKYFRPNALKTIKLPNGDIETTDLGYRDVKESAKEEIIESKINKLENGDIQIDLTHEDFLKSRMLMDMVPVVFYNSQTKQFLAKDFLCEHETRLTILHSLLDIKNRLERLGMAMLDFGRYVVQYMEGNGGFLKKNGWIIIIGIILLVIIIGVFGPKLKGLFGMG